MKISIIIPTHNGISTLPRTLRALSNLITPAGWEIEFILVDNGSDDGTDVLLRKFLETHPGLYVFEGVPGRASALNSGINVATGDYLLFTDDDVIPDKNWIEAYVDGICNHAGVSIFCGQIRLDWPRRPPGWLLRLEFRGRTLGATPQDRKEGPISPMGVKGANLLIKRSLLQARNVFRPDLGVSAIGPAIAGEETELVSSLAERGETVIFLPTAKILHIVRDHQMSIFSLIRRSIRNGRGIAASSVYEKVSKNRPGPFGIELWIIRQMMSIFFKILLAGISLNLDNFSDNIIYIAEKYGVLLEIRRRRSL